MELLSLLFLWPFLLIVFTFVIVSVNMVSSGIWFFAVTFFLVLYFGFRPYLTPKLTTGSMPEQLEQLRRTIVIFAISALLPLFIRHVIDASVDEPLIGIILGMVIGYAAVLWGMFLKNNKVLTYSNLFGGGITLIYVYIRLWELGELARIISSAIGLVIAVVVAVAKLKDKLK